MLEYQLAYRTFLVDPKLVAVQQTCFLLVQHLNHHVLQLV